MGFFGKITGIVLNTATLPIEVVKDIFTGGGQLTKDELEPYTIEKCKKIQRQIDKLGDDS